MLVEQFICGEDNYSVLLHDSKSSKTLAVDAPDGPQLLQKLADKNWQLDYLFLTHHHLDHVNGVKQIKREMGTKIIASFENGLGFHVDHVIHDEDVFYFGDFLVRVLSTPGHTLDSVCYFLPQLDIVFTGDTLFSLGCGRVFEGSYAQMLSSLKKIAALPDATKIYCGHEYTLSNNYFALTLDEDNFALQQKMVEIKILREKKIATLPVLLKEEKELNPFLRCHDRTIRKSLGYNDKVDDITVFTKMRLLKDEFKCGI